MEKWHKFDSAEMGISMDVPSSDGEYPPSFAGGIDEKAERYHHAKCISVGLHWTSAGLFAEGTPLITVSIIRMNNRQYEEYCTGKHYFADVQPFEVKTFPFYNEQLVWRFVDSAGDAKYRGRLFCRKDFKASDGDYVLTGAEIHSILLSSDHLKDNKADVEHILQSIRVRPLHGEKKELAGEIPKVHGKNER